MLWDAASESRGSKRVLMGFEDLILYCIREGIKLNDEVEVEACGYDLTMRECSNLA